MVRIDYTTDHRRGRSAGGKATSTPTDALFADYLTGADELDLFGDSLHSILNGVEDEDRVAGAPIDPVDDNNAAVATVDNMFKSWTSGSSSDEHDGGTSDDFDVDLLTSDETGFLLNDQLIPSMVAAAVGGGGGGVVVGSDVTDAGLRSRNNTEPVEAQHDEEAVEDDDEEEDDDDDDDEEGEGEEEEEDESDDAIEICDGDLSSTTSDSGCCPSLSPAHSPTPAIKAEKSQQHQRQLLSPPLSQQQRQRQHSSATVAGIVVPSIPSRSSAGTQRISISGVAMAGCGGVANAVRSVANETTPTHNRPIAPPPVAKPTVVSSRLTTSSSSSTTTFRQVTTASVAAATTATGASLLKTTAAAGHVRYLPLASPAYHHQHNNRVASGYGHRAATGGVGASTPLSVTNGVGGGGGHHPVLMLTDEERRLCEREGIRLPRHFPLSREEERNLKRIRRKIRNKLSAQDSRKRKKEYVDAMETCVRDCTTQNEQLHRQVEALESQKQSLAGQLRQLRELLAAKMNSGQRVLLAAGGSGGAAARPSVALASVASPASQKKGPQLQLLATTPATATSPAVSATATQQQQQQHWLLPTLLLISTAFLLLPGMGGSGKDQRGASPTTTATAANAAAVKMTNADIVATVNGQHVPCAAQILDQRQFNTSSVASSSTASHCPVKTEVGAMATRDSDTVAAGTKRRAAAAAAAVAASSCDHDYFSSAKRVCSSSGGGSKSAANDDAAVVVKVEPRDAIEAPVAATTAAATNISGRQPSVRLTHRARRIY